MELRLDSRGNKEMRRRDGIEIWTAGGMKRGRER
jgi:hypothetical protein